MLGGGSIGRVPIAGFADLSNLSPTATPQELLIAAIRGMPFFGQSVIDDPDGTSLTVLQNDAEPAWWNESGPVIDGVTVNSVPFTISFFGTFPIDGSTATVTYTISDGTFTVLLTVTVSSCIFWSGNDLNKFWDGDGELFWEQGRAVEMTYVACFVPETDALPAELSLALDVDAEQWDVEYITGSDAPYWADEDTTAYWDADTDLHWIETTYVPWPGKVTARRQEYCFKVRTGAVGIISFIRQFKVRLDVPDITETFEDVNISAGGTRLAIAETYRTINNVSMVLQDDGGSAAFLKILDKDPVLGPLIRAYDSGGSPTSALIDATVKGY